MSLHINRFIDRVRSAEHRGQRDLVMTMQEARDLQADIAKILLVAHAAAEAKPVSTPDAVEIHGGEF